MSTLVQSECFLGGRVTLYHGDCRDVLKTLPDNAIDSVVTDPPYALVFMGKQWDTGETAFAVEFWADVYRVLKPGGHVASFSGTRTYHRMAVAIEDAGFEIRDQLAWAYGSGFPKSHDVSKGIDRAAGAERAVVGSYAVTSEFKGRDYVGDASHTSSVNITAPAPDAARQWQGWGTALKPSYEPICLAQKPYAAQDLLAILVPTIGELLCKVASFAKTDMRLSELLQTCGFWNTGTSLNNCLAAVLGQESRFTTETANALTTDLKILKSLLSKITQDTITPDETQPHGAASSVSLAASISRSVIAKCERLASTTAGEIAIDWLAEEGSGPEGSRLSPAWEPICLARKPLIGTVAANVLQHGTGALNIDGCRVEGEVNDSEPYSYIGDNGIAMGAASERMRRNGGGAASPQGRWPANLLHDGSSEVVAAFPETGASKASAGRNGNDVGDVFSLKRSADDIRGHNDDGGSAARFFYTSKADADDRIGSKHPTVKPLDLMQWLCRLITPPGGTILDPFAGTGTTGEAAWREGFNAILIEREAEYCAEVRSRMHLALEPTKRAAMAAGRGVLRGAEGTPLFGGDMA